MNSILITGASSGIGRSTAERFLAAGWRVGLMARNAEKLAELANAHEAAVALPCDVSDAAAVERSVAEFGRLDALFNNAGMALPPHDFGDIPVEDWKRIVDVNLNGMFHVARAAYRAMRSQDPKGGRIINNGSISANTPREQFAGYTTTKHAITGLTKSIALDGRAHNIACGQIDIGNAATEMVAATARRAEAEGRGVEPVMSVDEVADAVLHMCGLPLGTNVLTMTIMATKMPYVGRG